MQEPLHIITGNGGSENTKRIGELNIHQHAQQDAAWTSNFSGIEHPKGAKNQDNILNTWLGSAPIDMMVMNPLYEQHEKKMFAWEQNEAMEDEPNWIENLLATSPCVSTHVNKTSFEPTEHKRTWTLLNYDQSKFLNVPQFNVRIRTRREAFMPTLDKALYVPLNYKLRVDINNPQAFQSTYLILTLRLCSENGEVAMTPLRAALTNVNESYAEFAPKFHASQSYAKHHQQYYFEIDVSSRCAPLNPIAQLRSPTFKVYCRRPAKHTRSKNQRRRLDKFHEGLQELVTFCRESLNENEKQQAIQLLQKRFATLQH